jgi:hypothetical protein
MTAAAALAVQLSGCGGPPAADHAPADHATTDSGVDTLKPDSLAPSDTIHRGTPIGDPAALPRPGVQLPRPADSLSGERS